MKVGVVIGRFQVDDLTVGHRGIIDDAKAHNDILCVLIGCSSAQFTKRNPLPFHMRAMMVQDRYEGAEIYPIVDQPSDTVWSDNLDKLLATIYPNADITLYYGRDSFVSHYSGRLKTFPTPDVSSISGTQTRHPAIPNFEDCQTARAALIFGIENQITRVSPTVDIAILNSDRTHVLMARKTIESHPTKMRFIGGFIDPKDESAEKAAIRECLEETRLEVGNLHYVGSFNIDDWRYRGAPESVITTFFIADALFGIASASDDIASLTWVPVDEVVTSTLDVHMPLALQLAKVAGLVRA